MRLHKRLHTVINILSTDPNQVICPLRRGYQKESNIKQSSLWPMVAPTADWNELCRGRCVEGITDVAHGSSNQRY